MDKPNLNNTHKTELRKAVMAIANKNRGKLNSYEFAPYVFGALFYRFLSTKITNYINEQEQDVQNYNYELDFETFSDENISNNSDIKETVKYIADDLGYFIKPSDLFNNVLKKVDTNENLNQDLRRIFVSIVESSKGKDSEEDFEGLFDTFDFNKSALGNNLSEKNEFFAYILKEINNIPIDSVEDSGIDVFGEVYEYLISAYGNDSNREAGAYFTPETVSVLLSKIVTNGKTEIDSIYDPTCGTGSLLLQTRKIHGEGFVKNGYFGQEIKNESYNLARMNMFLHDLNFTEFKIRLGDTLKEPYFVNQKFEAVVSNPPYSLKWNLDKNPVLLQDERFQNAGVLAPSSKADLAFVLHSLHYLSAKGVAAIVCFPGVFHRGGAEQKIRQYLVENNYIDTIIELPQNLFFGTGISTYILVMKKNKQNDRNIMFINASKLFKKEGKHNILTDENIAQIIDLFSSRKEEQYLSKIVTPDEIKENNYNLSVSNYVEIENTKPVIDIKELNAKIKATSKKINELRAEIDQIIEELES
ncbi:type I restriction-modification system subunit M [Mycoplasma nasistruthionis]|uniref:site-specific DNA-methyltransferase (adenine-specific) n=1 Tax=Mycoplasma nasistruthionis TaxID=353852 RepID=A0A5B7XUP5_9MOLU|nr:type I restriction-modification system subunit M [Mycoplasma nasistruthionis]QCZ36599.1 type I restriction-modification system subunit M [Mycoplasma nasistruthionis]